MAVSHEPVSLGLYRSVAVAASYSLSLNNDPSSSNPSQKERFYFALESSLQTTIQQHPGLLYGISDEAENGIQLYRQLSKFEKQDILEMVDSRDISLASNKPGNTTHEAVLSKVLGERHGEFFTANKPAWKMIVLEHEIPSSSRKSAESALQRLDIVFLAHHALADGMSGIPFHASLMANFPSISTSTSAPTWPMILNDLRPAPPQVEESIEFSPCDCEICSSRSTDDRPVWAGPRIPSLPIVSFQSMARIVTISPKDLLDVLRRCKQAKATLTTYLHALICASLVRRIEEDVPGIRASTPFSLRKHTKTSDDDIVDHASNVTCYVSRAQLNKLAACEAGSVTEEQHIGDLAQFFRREIVSKVNQFPHGDMIAKISQVTDFDFASFSQSRAGKERTTTYELSNLGSASTVIPPHDSGLVLDKMVFSQCSSVTGQALGFNCHGVVQESLVDAVAMELQTRLGG
ncbi:hypothetical protein F66182_874 [Fusarium sp. NRRL 66182]|nr:hypothetical protein F66182_874 [Fusarium sp. NRRL 66182]